MIRGRGLEVKKELFPYLVGSMLRGEDKSRGTKKGENEKLSKCWKSEPEMTRRIKSPIRIHRSWEASGGIEFFIGYEMGVQVHLIWTLKGRVSQATLTSGLHILLTSCVTRGQIGYSLWVLVPSYE